VSSAIIVVNAGSSSIKFSLFEDAGESLRLRLRGQIEALATEPRFIARDADGTVIGRREWGRGERLGHDGALDFLLEQMPSALQGTKVKGVGHRVVHGGLQYSQPVRIDTALVDVLQRFVPLAPLHQPHNLAPIRRLLERAPELPQVACFDTAFHRSNDDLVQMFGLPYAMFEQGVRRYGFHGLSYEYIASVLPRHSERAAAGGTVVLHLGNGASMCALRGGRSVATTMGFTAVDGLMMGTRTGNLDPGVVLYLMDQHRLDARAIEKLLYHESGLLGISGESSDMRTLLASAEPRSKLAVDLYCYRIRRELGSLAAALGGVDAIVFTAGIGENSAPIRARVLRDAGWLGVRLDEAANEAGGPLISSADSAVIALAIPTDEELMIAQHTKRVIDDG
jgi:acetate kinase